MCFMWQVKDPLAVPEHLLHDIHVLVYGAVPSHEECEVSRTEDRTKVLRDEELVKSRE